MSFPSNQDEFPNVCPYLGLADDADSHATYATEAHRCYRLESPTRIATNHQESFCLGANHPTCPVFRGEGVGSTTTAAAPTPLERGARGRAPREQAPREPKAPRAARAERPTPDRPLRPGSLNPRPRAGGISMPVATVGLFVLAAVVIALAFWLQSVVGGDDDNSLSPADAVRSQQAASRTATGAVTTSTPRPGTQTATTGTQTATPAGGTPATPTTGTGAKTYTVVAGDNCGIIAEAHNTTAEQIQALNPAIDAACSNLAVGQVLKLP